MSIILSRSRTALASLAALVALAGCAAGDSVDAPDDTPDPDPSAIATWDGLSMLGLHDGFTAADVRGVFTNPAQRGWLVHATYSTDTDWITGLANKLEDLGGDRFKNVVRIDYARMESAWADHRLTVGASVPPPGNEGYCLERVERDASGNITGYGPTRQVGDGSHLACYLAYVTDLVDATPHTHSWIVGNEMNMTDEAKAHPGGRIAPFDYANAFRASRTAIRGRPGHGSDEVFVGAVSPNAGGPAYQSGKDYLTGLLYALAPNEVDGIAIHAYGGWGKTGDNGGVPPLRQFEQGSGGALGYRSEAQWIDALGFSKTPLLVTEFSAHMHVSGAERGYDRQEVSDFIRAAYTSLLQWNGGPSNHAILGAAWFAFDNGGYPEESLANLRSVLAGTTNSANDNPYYAFQALASGSASAYPHGDPGHGGTCTPSAGGAPLALDGDPHPMTGRLRDYWQSTGGLGTFGYPIEDAGCHLDETGRILWSQFTQRARLEYHPEHAGTPYEVGLGLLGRKVAAANGVNPDAWGNSGDPHGGDCAFIGANDATGHWVCGAMLSYWRSQRVHDPSLDAFNQSLRLLGLPVSAPTTYHGLTVQWFERGRIELHPENASPYDVLGGLLGCEASGIQGFGC